MNKNIEKLANAWIDLHVDLHKNQNEMPEFNLSGFNSPQLAAICFKGERSEGKNRVIPRQLAAGIAIFSLAVFIPNFWAINYPAAS